MAEADAEDHQVAEVEAEVTNVVDGMLASVEVLEELAGTGITIPP